MKCNYFLYLMHVPACWQVIFTLLKVCRNQKKKKNHNTDRETANKQYEHIY